MIKFVSDLRQVGRWLSPGTLVSSTNKADRHDITEILLKVAISTIKQTNNCTDDNKMNPVIDQILLNIPLVNNYQVNDYRSHQTIEYKHRLQQNSSWLEICTEI